MSLIDWSETLSVSVRTFDEQHKRLIAIVNELADGMRARKGKETLAGVLKNLIEYTSVHFAAEEKLMSEHGYPDYAAHKHEHDDLVAKVLDFEKKYKADTILLSVELMNFLRDWLTGHIMKTDKAYAPFMNSKGVQ
ncbi:MAG: hemerythrin family protein [Spirochaetes bacterium]|nr:hemerythrin family protein [Spirochaetota bacterium]